MDAAGLIFNEKELKHREPFSGMLIPAGDPVRRNTG